MGRDAGGPAIPEVRVTVASRLGFEGSDIVDLRDTVRIRARVMETLSQILEKSVSVRHVVGFARCQYSLFEPQ